MYHMDKDKLRVAPITQGTPRENTKCDSHIRCFGSHISFFSSVRHSLQIGNDVEFVRPFCVPHSSCVRPSIRPVDNFAPLLFSSILLASERCFFCVWLSAHAESNEV